MLRKKTYKWKLTTYSYDIHLKWRQYLLEPTCIFWILWCIVLRILEVALKLWLILNCKKKLYRLMGRQADKWTNRRRIDKPVIRETNLSFQLSWGKRNVDILNLRFPQLNQHSEPAYNQTRLTGRSWIPVNVLDIVFCQIFLLPLSCRTDVHHLSINKRNRCNHIWFPWSTFAEKIC